MQENSIMDTKQEQIVLSVLQSRMARAALGLGIRDLAALADMSPNTIARFERGEKMNRRTIKAIRQALEGKGVEFVFDVDGTVGVLVR